MLTVTPIWLAHLYIYARAGIINALSLSPFKRASRHRADKTKHKRSFCNRSHVPGQLQGRFRLGSQQYRRITHWFSMNIVVVESPSKAKTINKYLGSGYEVLASFGHIRDLPPKDGSVDPDNDFRMLWEVDPQSQKRMNDIARALKGADKLILATDPDREGEAISWHVLEVLKENKALKDHKIERVVFNAITKQAVSEAMKHPRQIDSALVDAYLARRALDYLVGFTLSPVLWRKLPGARSAGRVQSVALRLVCDRELEIEKFVAKEYWSIVAKLATPRNEVFEARLIGADGQKIQRLDIGSGAEAESFTRDLENAVFTVTSVEAKPARRNPPPPFTTSTMQQEASRKLGFAPAVTMMSRGWKRSWRCVNSLPPSIFLFKRAAF